MKTGHGAIIELFSLRPKEGEAAMHFLKKDPEQVRRAQMLRLKRQMQSVQNEIEFVEILAQFWPLPNMVEKMERLEQRILTLNAQYQQFSGLQAS